MLRLFSYLTLSAAGEPTAAGTSFHPEHADVNATFGKNVVISQVRDGTRRRVRDPKNLFEVAGTLRLLANHVDLKSESLYLGSYRYLGPVLYDHTRNQLPICLFTESIIGTHRKSYVAYIDEADLTLLGQVTNNTNERTIFDRLEMPKVFNLKLDIVLDGLYTDADDITTAAWNARVSI